MPSPIIKVVVFKWRKEGYRSVFDAGHVNTAARMVARHTTVPYEFVCITDDGTGIDSKIKVLPLWADPHPSYGGGNWPNCFRRLRMFDPKIRRLVGPRWIWMDLDMFICGNIDHILTDRADFKIWRPDGGRSLCNGSLVLHQTGTRSTLWSDFSSDKVGTVEEFQAQTHHLGSDQAWIASHLQPEDEFFDSRQGVYAFRSLRNPHRERYLGALGRQREVRRPTPAAELEKAPGLPRAAPFTGLRRTPRGPRFNVPPGWRRRESSRPKHSLMAQRQDKRDQERLLTTLPANACMVFFPGQWHPWDQAIQDVYPWVKEHYQ